MIKGIAALTISVLLFPTAGFASGSAGSTAAAFLKIGPSPEWSAKGDAATALATGILPFVINPAAIADLRQQHLAFTYGSILNGVDLSTVGYAIPVNEFFTLGGLFTHAELGSVRRTTFSSVAAGTDLGRAYASSNGLTLGAGFNLGNNLNLGASFAYVNESLDNVTADAVALNLGLRYTTPVPGLRLGLAINNLGTDLTFTQEDEDLPFTVRGGVGFTALDDDLAVSADIVKVRDDDVSFHYGMQYTIAEMLDLRAGYNSRLDSGDKFTLGFGLRYNNLGLDYAFVRNSDLDNTHKVSFRVDFGQVITAAEKERKPIRRPDPTPPEIERTTVLPPAERQPVVVAAPKPAPQPVTVVPPRFDYVAHWERFNQLLLAGQYPAALDVINVLIAHYPDNTMLQGCRTRLRKTMAINNP